VSDEEASSRGWDRGRLDAFSDGVFAIAITILVLEIKVPPDLRHLGHDLEHEWPDYLAYVTSFLTIGGVWIAHHRLFSRVRVLDATMVQLNLLLLLLTAFLPFPTAVLAEALRAPEHTGARNNQPQAPSRSTATVRVPRVTANDLMLGA
jgi:uncharacterized membrane protein